MKLVLVTSEVSLEVSASISGSTKEPKPTLRIRTGDPEVISHNKWPGENDCLFSI